MTLENFPPVSLLLRLQCPLGDHWTRSKKTTIRACLYIFIIGKYKPWPAAGQAVLSLHPALVPCPHQREKANIQLSKWRLLPLNRDSSKKGTLQPLSHKIISNLQQLDSFIESYILQISLLLGWPKSLFGFFWKMFCVCVHSVTQLYLTLCDPMDCNSPGFSVYRISQARILEEVVIPFTRESSWPRDWTRVSWIAGGFCIVWETREAQDIMEKLKRTF